MLIKAYSLKPTQEIVKKSFFCLLFEENLKSEENWQITSKRYYFILNCFDTTDIKKNTSQSANYTFTFLNKN